MKLVEVTPEKDIWITQKILYAYETHRVAALFVETDENLNPVYGYQFLDGSVEELPDSDYIKNWEDAEKVFLEVVCDLLGDEERYYNSLKDMCKELVRQTEFSVG